MSLALAPAETDRSPHPTDVHVGGRVRLRRRILGLTQEKLADTIGVTFQQVQKYERGTNRISASKLFEIARTLGAPIPYFFEGLDDPTREPLAQVAETAARDFLLTTEGLELSLLFPTITSRLIRRQILALIRELADEDSVS
jgi:transcriptional regulator with XRE-family HTH domain